MSVRRSASGEGLRWLRASSAKTKWSITFRAGNGQGGTAGRVIGLKDQNVFSIWFELAGACVAGKTSPTSAVGNVARNATANQAAATCLRLFFGLLRCPTAAFM